MDLQLHHTGILVKDIEKAAKEYTERFGYQIISKVIHDPVQTAFVQFLHGKHDSAYLELIAPDGSDSKLCNALIKKGGGLNHLCYRVDDIEASCRYLNNHNMFVLQAPVSAAAFSGRRIAWLMGRDGIPVELVEQGTEIWEDGNE